MTETENGHASRKSDYEVIGTRPLRHDGTDKVTGRALYGADIRLPGMLYGAVLRSPHAHARILSIDTQPGRGAARGAGGGHRGRPAGCGSKSATWAKARSTCATRATIPWRGIRCCILGTPSRPWRPPACILPRKPLELIQVEYEVLPPVLDVHAGHAPGCADPAGGSAHRRTGREERSAQQHRRALPAQARRPGERLRTRRR